MKRIATLAALALVIGIGGALRVVACEYDATDGPVVTVPQQVADCIATNCTIDEQKATPPAQGGSTGTDGATTPRVEKDLKDLSKATAHALEPKASTPPAPPAPK